MKNEHFYWVGISCQPEDGPVAPDYDPHGHSHNIAVFSPSHEEIAGCDEYCVFADGVKGAQRIADALTLCDSQRALIDELVERLKATLPIMDDAYAEALEKAEDRTESWPDRCRFSGVANTYEAQIAEIRATLVKAEKP